MEQQDNTVEPLLEPAEGARPEQEGSYASAQHELSRAPLQEPAEGAREDTGSDGGER